MVQLYIMYTVLYCCVQTRLVTLEGGLIYIFAGFGSATLLNWCSYVFRTHRIGVYKKNVREPPCSGVLKIVGAPLKVKIFFSMDVLFMVFKRTALENGKQ